GKDAGHGLIGLGPRQSICAGEGSEVRCRGRDLCPLCRGRVHGTVLLDRVLVAAWSGPCVRTAVCQGRYSAGDVIHSAHLPGPRFPSAPGPSLTQIEECLAATCATADVTAACIACAW